LMNMALARQLRRVEGAGRQGRGGRAAGLQQRV
jgi:hypothetical protein